MQENLLNFKLYSIQFITMRDTNIKSLYMKALRLSKEGNYLKSIKEFNKLILQDPSNSEAISDRGVVKYHLNNLEGALEDMNTALNLDPSNPFRYASRAYIKERSGDTLGAIEDYRKSIELDPENAVSHNNLGLLEEKLGYMNRADKRFELADNLNISKDSSFNSESAVKRDELIQRLLSELNIPVEEKSLDRPGLINQMLAIFKSSAERKDFLKFLKNLLRIRR
jgi:Flp pilus assembly protein TadD